jgi:hypothetical protein
MTQSNFGESARSVHFYRFQQKLLHAVLSLHLQSNEREKRATDPEFNEHLTVLEAVEFLTSQRRLRRRPIIGSATIV